MKVKKSIILFILSLVVVFVLIPYLYNRYQKQNVPVNNGAFLLSLSSFNEFEQFAGAPLDNAYPNITSVKVVYDLQRKQIYFINSHLYRLHYDFCSQVLGYKLGLTLFNIANYSGGRDYYLANINYLRKNKQFVLEFSSSDEIDSLQIIDMYNRVSKAAFFKSDLKLLLNNTNCIRYFSQQKSIPTCPLGALNEGQNFQLIQAGSCLGRLVVCEDLKSQYLDIKPSDIIVVKGTPNELPLCKAVISDCFQTPLSHIQVLSHNKKMPSAFLKTIFSNDSILKYNGKIVKLDITPDTLRISPALQGATLVNTSKKITLPLNSNLQSIILIDDCKNLTNADIGTKAKGFSDLKVISDNNKNLFQTPEGAFVIPFYFYKQHLQNSEIDSLLKALYSCDINQTIVINDLLSGIRTAILKTPLSVSLLSQVQLQIIENKYGGTYRFRSSSNAEDLSDFSGAGLYESKTGILHHSKKSIEKAIKKVWASMYNYRAYQERAFATIDETTAAMSILVHRSFPNEDVNGVIITKNIYRNDYPALIINAQKGDVSTVSPPDNFICEQLILTQNKVMNPFSKKIAAKYISYSSLHPNSPLLTYEQLLRIQKGTEAVKSLYEKRNLDWDIEFKFEGEKLYFKQVRPYR